jgi:hypothetical protein
MELVVKERLMKKNFERNLKIRHYLSGVVWGRLLIVEKSTKYRRLLGRKGLGVLVNPHPDLIRLTLLLTLS